MDFTEYIRQEIFLSQTASEGLTKSISRKVYAKKELILPVESTSKQIYFIEQGTARIFYAKKAKDITLHFLQENGIGLPVDSIFYNQVCKFGIEALCTTTVVTLPYDQWDHIANGDTALQKFTQKLMIGYVKNATDRIFNLKFQTPQERYDNLFNEFPAIFLKASLGHIASYLGITQETLSRLRAKK
jgi:CRP-like cAMP-binding protein